MWALFLSLLFSFACYFSCRSFMIKLEKTCCYLPVLLADSSRANIFSPEHTSDPILKGGWTENDALPDNIIDWQSIAFF
jgi:hypothetical protein